MENLKFHIQSANLKMSTKIFCYATRIILITSILISGCDSAQDKELKRLQVEKLRLETELQNQKLVAEKSQAERDEQERKLAQKMRVEQIEREQAAQIALQEAETKRLQAQQFQEERENREREDRERQYAANNFVKSRADYRVARIVGVLSGTDPSATVISHNCNQSGCNFKAAIRVNYRGGFSGDALSFNGVLTHNSDGSEYFSYDPLPPDIVGRLKFIGVSDEKLSLLINGKAVITFD